MDAIINIAREFCADKEIVSLKPLNAGHINDTNLVKCAGDYRFILQKINKNVFKRPDEVMSNIGKVTDHIRAKLKAAGEDYVNGVLSFLSTGEGKLYYTDSEGEYWRAYVFVDGDCFQICESEELFTRVGEAFGRFQQQLSDFDASELFESIKNFHNTESRYADFEEAVKSDAVSRAAKVSAEIEFVRSRKDDCSYIVKGIESGRFPLRVTHNDTKLNNIIMDKATGKGLCVIDLDTVMPGSMLYDFGDAIRFGAASAAEDETDLSKVFVRPEMFDAFAKGYIAGLEGSATENEIRAFPLAAKIITLETGIRFLTDYLNGDTYFKTAYPNHNLDRARNQFKLVQSIEENTDILNSIVEKYIWV